MPNPSSTEYAHKTSYDEEYILKKLMEGKTREELAEELHHKNFRTIDMYMRRRGYVWDTDKQIYITKSEAPPKEEYTSSTSKVEKILSLFKAGIDPREVAKRVSMKDHRAVAEYMRNKGYVWSAEKQTYILQKGKQEAPLLYEPPDSSLAATPVLPEEKLLEEYSLENLDEDHLSRLERLLPMLEMMDRNKEKLAELLSVGQGNKIPRYIVGGITITKSLCMSHPLAELVKEFSREKNISQREIFEVSIIEFLKKYGYEKEVQSLFS